MSGLQASTKLGKLLVPLPDSVDKNKLLTELCNAGERYGLLTGLQIQLLIYKQALFKQLN